MWTSEVIRLDDWTVSLFERLSFPSPPRGPRGREAVDIVDIRTRRFPRADIITPGMKTIVVRPCLGPDPEASVFGRCKTQMSVRAKNPKRGLAHVFLLDLESFGRKVSGLRSLVRAVQSAEFRNPLCKLPGEVKLVSISAIQRGPEF